MRLWLSIATLLGACSFNGSVNTSTGGTPIDADISMDDGQAQTPWWDASYTARARITVTTGANSPMKGYADYTAQLLLDTATLVGQDKMQATCDDLRVLFWDGSTWQELLRHVVACNSGATEIRFAIREDISANTADDRYFLYYGNTNASAMAALAPTDVYLWHDDASQDRLASYDKGRIDTWGSTNNWAEQTTWNADGYYEYITADDFVSSFRRPVDERDVYTEVELFHTNCFPSNMVTGLIVRGIIASGSSASETADHYYLGQRGHQGECGGGYGADADIFKTERMIVAVDAPDPPALPRSQWRKQGIAAVGVNPTRLTFWDNDSGWPSLGWPQLSPWVSGEDADDYEGAGFTGLWIAQDSGRFRNMLIRRYTDPEPLVTLGPESSAF